MTQFKLEDASPMGAAIDPDRAAVLALHWQVNVIKPDGFFGGIMGEPVARSGVIERAVEFHDAARAHGLPVIFTRFTVPDGGGQLVLNTPIMEAIARAQERFRPESPGAQLIPEMAALGPKDFSVDNQKLSGLAGSDLVDRLAEQKIDVLLITGVSTDVTVEQTARAGTDLGFRVHVISDCTMAGEDESHQAALSVLERTTAGCLIAEEALGLISAS
jgi:nicotinamidase-related amidase